MKYQVPSFMFHGKQHDREGQRGQADKAASYLPKVEAALRAADLPFASHRAMIPISLTVSESYDFVVCEMSADYSCFFNCIATGSDLEVSWLVQDHMIRGTYRIPLLGPLLLSVMKRYTFAKHVFHFGERFHAEARVVRSVACGSGPLTQQ